MLLLADTVDMWGGDKTPFVVWMESQNQKDQMLNVFSMCERCGFAEMQYERDKAKWGRDSERYRLRFIVFRVK